MNTLKKDDDEDINYDPMLPHMSGGGFLDSFGNALKSASGVGLFGAPNLAADAQDVASNPELSNTLKAVGNAGGMNLPPTPEPQIGPDPTQTPKLTAPPHVSAKSELTQKAGLPGMPPEMTPDALGQLISEQKAQRDKYGPEQQMAVQNALIQGRSGFGPSLARAGGGLADAIMQGVARAGSSNFQKNITDQQNQMASEQMATLKDAQTGKMAQMQAEIQMSLYDPNSPLSRVAQNSNRPVLKKLGWTDEQINRTSASTIDEATKNHLSYFDSKNKADLARATTGNTESYQNAMVGLKGKEEERLNKEQALKSDTEASKHWFSHPLNASDARARISGGSSAPTESAHPQAEGFEEWASANPNDPRLPEIRKRLGK